MSKVVLVVLGLVALCAAQDGVSPAAKVDYSPQDRFLAHDAVGNFACKIDTVSATLDVPGEEDKMVVTAEDLEAYLGQTATIEWAHVNQFFFASLDGRNEEKNLGTGGGDLGEFIQALESYTRVTGATFTYDDVTKVLDRYLGLMSRDKFFFETDERTYRKLAIATGCQNLKIAGIGDKRKRQAILDIYAQDNMSEFIGDPYVRFLAHNAEALEIRRDYITFAIQAFHHLLWTSKHADKLCYTMVKGRLDPKALIQVKTPGYCIDQGLAPLISSQMCSGQVFIDHTDAVKLFRRELVQLIAQPGDNPQDVLAQFNTLAQGNLEKFWDTFVGLPRFTVTFSNSATILNAKENADVQA